jgi:hypothetical protein
MKKIFSCLVVMMLIVSGSLIFTNNTAYAGRLNSINGTISGVVLDNNGKPLKDVQVEILKLDVVMSEGVAMVRLNPYTVTSTSKTGQYKVSVPEGTYRVWFVPDDLDLFAQEAYPDAPAPDLGMDVTVKKGQSVSKISVVLEKGYTVTGQIADPYGIPLANCDVHLGIQIVGMVNGSLFPTATTDSEGRFEFKGVKEYSAWLILANMGPPRPFPEYTNSYFQFSISHTDDTGTAVDLGQIKLDFPEY